MRIIEKIEISKFRSIGESENFETLDLNIFSGSNDSGKSNFLKALNLFFNNQTDIDVRYNSDSDFNKWFRDNNVRGQRIIEIKLYIAKGRFNDKDGINKGFIAKKLFRSDGGIETIYYRKNGQEILNNEFSYRKASAVINEKIRFVYIPTIRDVQFRESIQRLIQEIANSTDKRFKSQDLKEAFKNMEIGINSQLSDLTKHVKEKVNIEVDTNVNFGTLLESLTFETSEKIKIKKRGKKEPEIQKVSLRNRGEGIQMQFFSFMLWFISKHDTKHFYIWGYEEPEIAFEFKRQFELADVFQSIFANVAQIFVTTHSPAFAFMESSVNTKVFRINNEEEKKSKSSRYSSKVVPIDEYYEGLFEELSNASAENKAALERDIWGINAQKISKMLGESMEEIIGLREISSKELHELKALIKKQNIEKSKLEEKIGRVENELNNLFPENIFICEDANAIKLWKNILYDKLGFNQNNLNIISSKGCTTNEVETAIVHLRKQRVGYNPKIFRQFDRDGFTLEQTKAVKRAKENKYNNLRYRVEFLPVNEIENFAILTDSFYTEELLKEFNNFSKISVEFNGTINSNLQSVIKIVDKADQNLFNSTQKLMIDEANSNLLLYYPGKEIKKLKQRFNPEKIIMETSFDDLPTIMKDFLNEIKLYYNSSSN